jgi:VWFA-related protein
MRRLMLLALLALPIVGQEKLVESIEVHVVNVDVVVTDRAGNPIHGLKRDDFELFENGKPQPLSNFYEVRPDETGPVSTSTQVAPQAAPAPTPEARARHIVMFIDDYSVEPRMRTKVLDSLAKFVDTQMHEGDSASVVSWSHSTRVLVPFTTDRAALKGAIKNIAPRASIQSRIEGMRLRSLCAEDARARGRARTSARDDCEAMIKARVDEEWALERDLIEAMRVTMASLAGIDGKKVMIVAGAQLPELPGVDLYQYFNQLFGGTVSPYMEASHHSQKISIAQLAREANANGVTLYTIDTNDARNTASAEFAETMSPDESFMEFTNTAAAFQTLAEITGGLAIANTNNTDIAFETVAHDLSSWYSLGYRPSDEKSTGNRSLTVKLKNPAYRVRARQTYALKSNDEQMSDRVLANVVHEGMKSDWAIQVNTGTPAKDGRNFRVPIEVLVPATVTLLPAEGNKVAGGFDIFIAVGDADGRMSSVTKRAQPISIPSVAEKGVRQHPLIFNAVLLVRPGKSTISVGVIDEISNTAGFARANIVAK